ncbi:MAG: carboxymuconolactone decarboxylase family protein [Hyphomicrobiales bacterium]
MTAAVDAPALTPSLAAIACLSAAIADGPPDDVAARAAEALEAGVPARAVYEVALQSYLFVGFPRAIEALFAIRPRIAGAGGIPAAAAPHDAGAWERDGRKLCGVVYGPNFEKLLATMRSLSPDLADWMILEGYGKTLSRPELPPLEREIGVVAILTTTRMWRQLRSHAIGAIHVGATRAQVREAIVLCVPWAGGDAVAQALGVTGLD